MSQPEVITVNSEALEAQIRDLLPSQRGFGSELQASNVIMPIIDLTPTAEGSILRTDLQTALSFGSITAFDANNSTAVVANNAGFVRVVGCASGVNDASTSTSNSLQITDGSSTKIIWEQTFRSGTDKVGLSNTIDLVVYLRAGDTLNAVSDDNTAHFIGSSIQIATVTGELNNPSGFVAE